MQEHATEIELRILVEGGLNHYATLFRMKADVARADIFYLLSGIWRTSVERYFHWIGGFRPSELLNVNLLQLYFGDCLFGGHRFYNSLHIYIALLHIVHMSF